MQVVKIKFSPVFKSVAIPFCVVATVFTLSRYALLIQHLIALKYNWQFEFCMVIGMILFQYPLLYKKSYHIKLNYYFALMQVSLIGAVLLWPLLCINLFYALGDVPNLAYFFTVVVILFFMHKQAVIKLVLPEILSYSWAFYRFIILLFILLK